FGRLQDRQVGRLLALENAAGVNASLAKGVRKASAVAHQAAGRGEFAPRVNCRNPMSVSQRHKFFAPGGKERSGSNDERVRPLSGKGGKAAVEVAFRAGLENMKFLAESARGVLQVVQLARGGQKVRVNERGYHGRLRKQFVQEPQSLCLQCSAPETHARGI